MGDTYRVPAGQGVRMNIGEQRRTIYVEPIEEPPDAPVREPDHEEHPIPHEPIRLPEPVPGR